LKKILLLLLSFTILSFGSATIFSGKTNSISIDSEPTGAQVFIGGQLRGLTPLSVMMKKGLSTKTLRVQKDGYVMQELILTKTFDPVALVNIFWDLSTTDFLTGAIFEYTPNNYYITLKKK
jgi:hypothetical protein